MRIKRAACLMAMVTTFSFAYSARGMVAYKKICSHCHGPAFKGAAMLESDEWKEMFENGAQKLKKIHSSNKNAMKKINSHFLKKRLEDLKRFMMNNGRDKGVVRSCDGLNCG